MNPFINDKSAIVDKDYQPAMAINIDKDNPHFSTYKSAISSMESPFFTVKSPSQDVQALEARVPSALRAVEPGGDLPRWLYRALQWGGPWDVMA